MSSRARMVAALVMALFALSGVANVASAGFSSASCMTPSNYDTSDPIASCIYGALPYVFIGLLISFYIVALAFLAGEVLNIAALKNWYKGELWESAKSLALVVIIFAALVVMGAIASQIQGIPSVSGSYGCPGVNPGTSLSQLYDVVDNFLCGQVQIANESFNNLIGTALGVSYIKSIKFQTFFALPIPPIPLPDIFPTAFAINMGTDWSPYASSVIDVDPARPQSFLKDITQTFIFPVLFAQLAIYFIMPLLFSVGLGIFIPLGLIFRAIPFLRSIGGTILAIGIGLALVFPSLFAVVNASIIQNVGVYGTNPGSPGIITCSLGNGIPIIGGVFSGMCATVLNLLDPYQIVFTGISQPAGTALMNGFYGGTNAFTQADLFYILNPLLYYAAPVVLQFILLVIDLIIGIIITGNIARMLGGSLRLRIGSKMKLA